VPDIHYMVVDFDYNYLVMILMDNSL